MSVYHPTAEEISASMGVPMEGFFDGAEAVLATPAPPAAHKALAKIPTLSAEPVPREGTHVEGVGETTPLPAERFTPSEGVIPSIVVHTKITSPVLPLVISTSDPFANISQAAKGSASLVVTPSSIPGSATRGPDLDLSSEGSADIFEDPDDVPMLKRTISDSDEEGSASSEPDFMGMYLPSPLSFFFVFALHLHTYLPTCRNFYRARDCSRHGNDCSCCTCSAYSCSTFNTCFSRTCCPCFFCACSTPSCYTRSPHSW